MEQPHRIARVVVDVPARALSEPFDYAVPPALCEQVRVGCPVAVPFGHRACVGYVAGFSASSAHADRLKEIDAVLGVPVFDEHALDLAEWIALQYASPLSEALKLFLPPGGAPRVVRAEDGSWRYEGRQMSAASERLVMLADPFVPRPNATVQRAVLEALAAGPVTVPELAAEIPGASAAVDALERAGAVTVIERRRYRRPQADLSAAPRHLHTPEQASAIEAIAGCVGEGRVLLLHGVTGSGKTEVYLAAIERVLAAGRSAIVLVPEISLTPQTVGRFRARLGDDVAVIHSRLSAGERFDQWQLALEGRVRVVVGARSALFAPLAGLGLIVIDEEHEPSYKQGQSPRYHAREVAERLCVTRGCALVLGSATPSMEAMTRADSGRYRRLRLPSRVGGGAVPHVTVVDMTAEFADGHRSIYSRELIEALRQVADLGQKAVLFLNRRGYASFLLCRECGFVPRCEACSVSLTYHETTGRLRCHQCDASYDVPPTCPRCGSAYLRRFGAGTQRAEADLRALMPDMPVVRMDADTTSAKGGHERALMRFEALDRGVLLGTQMIAKGLDYPEVTLVGVLNADTSMHVPDFRAAERTYQLLEQVAGRAGRGTSGGKVIIQTYWPDHPAVRAVATGNPSPLYVTEHAVRSELGFPPYGRIANVLTSGSDRAAARRQADTLSEMVRQTMPETWELVGPARAPLERVKGNWRWHFLVKAPSDAEIGPVLTEALRQSPAMPGVSRIVDIDPVGML